MRFAKNGFTASTSKKREMFPKQIEKGGEAAVRSRIGRCLPFGPSLTDNFQRTRSAFAATEIATPRAARKPLSRIAPNVRERRSARRSRSGYGGSSAILRNPAINR